MISKPNFKNAYIKANELLVSSNAIKAFPFSFKTLIKQEVDLQCMSYAKALEKGVDISVFGSESAMLMSLNGRNIIFFNEKESKERIRFSIAHELGHYYLKHDFDKKEFYQNHEVEANFFAAQLLVPEQMLLEFARRGCIVNDLFISKNFGISTIAANKKKQTVLKAQNFFRCKDETEYDDLILLKYASFMDSIQPIKYFELYDEDLDAERNTWR